MGEPLLLLLALQTIIATSLSATLPFPHAIGTVTPIKPRPLLPSSVPEVLPTIKSLECDGEDLISPLFSSLGASREFSSPLALTTSSRALPVPKINNLSISKVKLPEGCEDSLPESIKKLLKGTSVTEINSDVCSTEILFPFKRLVKDTITIPKLSENVPEFVKPGFEDMCFSSSVSEVSIKANPFGPHVNKFTSINPNTFVPNTMLAPNIKSPATVSVDSLKKNAFESTIPKLCVANNGLSTASSPLPNSIPNPCIGSSGTVSESPAIKSTVTPFSELPTSSFTPSYLGPLQYPLSYKSMFLPRVRTPELSFRNCRPPFITTGNLNSLNPPDSFNLLSPTPPLPFHLKSFNERNYPDLTCSSQLPSCGPMPSCVNPITMTERSNLLNLVQIPKITPPLSTDSGFCQTRLEIPRQYKNSFTPSVGCENIRHPYSCTTLDTTCTNNILPILDSIPFVTVDDISYSYPNGLPTVTPKRPCENTLDIYTSDIFCSNSPFQSTPTQYLKENIPKIKSAPIISLDELPNCNNNFDGNICSSDFSIPNMFPNVEAFVDSLNGLKCVNIPDVCSTSRCSDICSCTTSVSPVLPCNNCCSKVYTSSDSPISSYINISPSFPISKSSSKMVSSINDMVANITQNLLSSYISCLKLEPNPVCKKPSCSPKYNPNIPDFRPKVTSIRSPLPPVNLSYEKAAMPIICQPTTNYSPHTDSPIIIQLDSLFPSNNPSFVSSSSDTSPLVSLINYSSTLSPSYLPSPTLPYSAPFYPESPVLKLSSSKGKKEKDRLLELMILSELLDGDDNYEWDELDTLLALLAIS